MVKPVLDSIVSIGNDTEQLQIIQVRCFHVSETQVYFHQRCVTKSSYAVLCPRLTHTTDPMGCIAKDVMVK